MELRSQSVSGRAHPYKRDGKRALVKKLSNTCDAVNVSVVSAVVSDGDGKTSIAAPRRSPA